MSASNRKMLLQRLHSLLPYKQLNLAKTGKQMNKGKKQTKKTQPTKKTNKKQYTGEKMLQNNE